ncbi:MAG: hypothetical protein AAF449_10280, partial [Myxococcota bacterium]
TEQAGAEVTVEEAAYTAPSPRDERDVQGWRETESPEGIEVDEEIVVEEEQGNTDSEDEDQTAEWSQEDEEEAEEEGARAEEDDDESREAEERSLASTDGESREAEESSSAKESREAEESSSAKESREAKESLLAPMDNDDPSRREQESPFAAAHDEERSEAWIQLEGQPTEARIWAEGQHKKAQANAQLEAEEQREEELQLAMVIDEARSEKDKPGAGWVRHFQEEDLEQRPLAQPGQATAMDNPNQCRGHLEDGSRCLRKSKPGLPYCAEHVATWAPIQPIPQDPL